MDADDDWRLTWHEDALYDAVFRPRRFRALDVSYEHEHCKLCWTKFMDPDFDPRHRQFIAENPEVLTSGYASVETRRAGVPRYFICPTCFADFRERYRWALVESDQ